MQVVAVCFAFVLCLGAVDASRRCRNDRANWTTTVQRIQGTCHGQSVQNINSVNRQAVGHAIAHRFRESSPRWWCFVVLL